MPGTLAGLAVVVRRPDPARRLPWVADVFPPDPSGNDHAGVGLVERIVPIRGPD